MARHCLPLPPHPEVYKSRYLNPTELAAVCVREFTRHTSDIYYAHPRLLTDAACALMRLKRCRVSAQPRSPQSITRSAVMKALTHSQKYCLFIFAGGVKKRRVVRVDIRHETICHRKTDAGFNRGCSDGLHFLSRVLVLNLKFVCVSEKTVL